MFFNGAIAAAWFDRGKLRQISASLRDTSRQGMSTRREKLASNHNLTQRRNDDRMVWIDGIGGFLLTLSDELTIGQPNTEAGDQSPALSILADLSRRHATLRRESGAYVLEPHATTFLDGKLIDSPTLLTGGEEIRLGDNVRFRFTRPHALSATAKLVVESGHRLSPAADAVLLMAESCVIGPQSHSHVRCPKWANEAILYRTGQGLGCRSNADLMVEGKSFGENAPAESGTRIEGQDFSLSIEWVDKE